MVRGLILGLTVLASGCASLGRHHDDIAPAPAPAEAERVGMQVQIADGVLLTLPAPPNFPETRTIVQTGRAQYGDQRGAFDAVLSLSPERVEIVIAMIAGPRLVTVEWDAAGVREERAIYAPASIPVENMLADIFLTTWPPDAVAAALPEGVELTVGEDGVRTIRRGEEVIIQITPDSTTARTVVRNAALGYEVALVTQSQE
jgi:hypothetical protein